jgi:mannosyltransferase OCH1-like enzyme
VFHQIWLGPAPLPEQFAPYVESWRRHHPEWQHRLWTEETLPPGLRPEIYQRLRSPAERSDVLRLELLAREGGVYVDTDFECLRPIDPLLEGVDLFAAESKAGRVNNALIGAAAAHPAIVRARDDVRPLTRHGTVDKDGTGPFFIDRVLKEAHATIFERPLFYPTPAEQAGAYAIHHMARSWKDAAGYRKSIYLARVRLATTEAELAQASVLARARLRVEETRARAGRGRAKLGRELQPRLDVLRARAGRGGARSTRVPRVLHHVWVAPGELPGDAAARLETWRICHPDWEQRLWREDDLPAELVRPEAADPFRSPAEREELLRLELVLRHGGVAADLGLACRRRLDASIAGLDAFAGSSAPGVPDPALVGAVPGHPALERALAAAQPFEWHMYPAGTTGREALVHAQGAGLVLLPPQLLGGGRGSIASHGDRADSPQERERLLAEVIAVERRLRDASASLAERRSAGGA